MRVDALLNELWQIKANIEAFSSCCYVLTITAENAQLNINEIDWVQEEVRRHIEEMASTDFTKC